MLLPAIIVAVGVTVAGGSVLGALLWRRRKKQPSEQSIVAPAALSLSNNQLAPFGFALGDVLQGDSDDFWITGAWALTESIGAVASVCCLSEETEPSRVLIATGKDERVVCSQVSCGANWLDRPMSVVVDGVIFRRASVIPVAAASVGVVCRAFEPELVWMVYRSDTDETVWVMADKRQALAWGGHPDPLVTWRNLGGGDKTLRRWD